MWEEVGTIEDGALTIVDASKYFFQQRFILDALIRSTPLPSLKSLTIANIVPFPVAAFELDTFAQLLAPLEHFTFTVKGRHLTGFHFDELWESFWSELVPRQILTLPQTHLTSLSLISDQPVGWYPRIEFSELHYPNLRALELGGFTFDRHRRIEDFILRHCATLNSLVLDSCPMQAIGVGGGGLINPVVPHRRWAEVCERFHELTELLQLQILIRTEWGFDIVNEVREEMCFYYTRSLTSYGYDRRMEVDRPVPAIEEEDKVALETLMDVINARRQARGLR